MATATDPKVLSFEDGAYITDGKSLFLVMGLDDLASYKVENALTGLIESLDPVLIYDDEWRVVTPVVKEKQNGA
jgi:hypothetical protein